MVRTNNDPNGLKVQLGILKERVKYLQEKNDSLERQNSDLQKITEEKIQLKIAFEVERQKRRKRMKVVQISHRLISILSIIMTIAAITIALFFIINYGPSQSVLIGMIIILAFLGIFIAFTEWSFSSNSSIKSDLEESLTELEIRQRELEAGAQRERLEAGAQRERKRLELETQGEMLEAVRLRLDLMQKRLDLHEQSLDYSFRVTNQIIETLSPNMDQETKKMLTQDLIPHILQSQTHSLKEFTDNKEEFEPFDSGEI